MTKLIEDVTRDKIALPCPNCGGECVKYNTKCNTCLSQGTIYREDRDPVPPFDEIDTMSKIVSLLVAAHNYVVQGTWPAQMGIGDEGPVIPMKWTIGGAVELAWAAIPTADERDLPAVIAALEVVCAELRNVQRLYAPAIQEMSMSRPEVKSDHKPLADNSKQCPCPAPGREKEERLLQTMECVERDATEKGRKYL